MRKAVLVIDMPETCGRCQLCQGVAMDGTYVCSIFDENGNDRFYDDGKYSKPDWCPLKLMPEKVSIPDFDDIVKAKSENAYEVGMCMYNRGLNRGYNICIDKILGD